jgi:hypothetical protein
MVKFSVFFAVRTKFLNNMLILNLKIKIDVLRYM